MHKTEWVMFSTLWAILAVILFGAQFITGVFDLLFVAVSALFVALGVAIIPGFDQAVWLQVLVWIASSFFSVWAFRKRFRKLFRGEELQPEKNRNSGEKARVIEAISPEKPGRISFRGTSWTALSIDEDIAVGTEVYILELDGLNYTVSSRLLEDDLPSTRLSAPSAGDKLEGPQ